MNEWLLHGPNLPGFNAILFFTALDFTSITSRIHNWALFLLWLCMFILSGVISLLFSSSILGTYRPGKFIFQWPIFFSFLYNSYTMGFLRQEYWSDLLFLSLVDHVLSELSTMTHPSWVTLHGMAHNFFELDKAVLHMISLASFLWLWFMNAYCFPHYLSSLQLEHETASSEGRHKDGVWSSRQPIFPLISKNIVGGEMVNARNRI